MLVNMLSTWAFLVNLTFQKSVAATLLATCLAASPKLLHEMKTLTVATEPRGSPHGLALQILMPQEGCQSHE